MTGFSEKNCRDVVHARSSGDCERCGQRGVQMHHRRNRSQGGQWSPSNIVHVCVACHGWITVNPAFAVRLGYTIQGTQQCPEDVPVLRRGRWSMLWDDGAVTVLSRLDERVLAVRGADPVPLLTGRWGETPAAGEGYDDDWPLGVGRGSACVDYQPREET